MADPVSRSGMFPPTRWTRVLAARGDDTHARRALDELCALYWTPVYAFIRRQGRAPADAEDLTQGFFAELLARGSLASVAAENGRLRTFLLKAVTRYMSHQREKAQAAKRGGGVPVLSLDFASAEGQFIAEPGHRVTPDLEFDRQWALTLLDRALAAARSAAGQAGRAALFEDLKGLISLDAATPSYATIAARHGLSEGAVKIAAHRLRASFRGALCRMIAETVASDDQIDGEIQHLFEIFQAP
jgi:DNA-directed RNA polymerase specialized sigma24 family protein